jgi:hypothetical protein
VSVSASLVWKFCIHFSCVQKSLRRRKGLLVYPWYLGRRQKRIVESREVIAAPSFSFYSRTSLGERTVSVIPHCYHHSTPTNNASNPAGFVSPHTTSSVGQRRASSTAASITKRLTSSHAALFAARSKSHSARSRRRSAGCTARRAASRRCSARRAHSLRRAARSPRRRHRTRTRMRGATATASPRCPGSPPAGSSRSRGHW